LPAGGSWFSRHRRINDQPTFGKLGEDGFATAVAKAAGYYNAVSDVDCQQAFADIASVAMNL
jgi:hypothetical protein